MTGLVVDARLPQPPRGVCEIELGGRHVSVTAPQRGTFIASIGDPTKAGPVEIARTDGTWGTGDGNVIFGHYAMSVDLLGDRITQERLPLGRDRWLMHARSAAGRTWTWRPVGRLFADRMELTRDDDDAPLVTYLMRPVPGRPRSGGGPPTLSWEAAATPGELLLVLLWALAGTHLGVLPKMQRVARADFL